MKQTNISIIETYKSENKSTKVKELVSSKSAAQFNRIELMNILFLKESSVCYIPLTNVPILLT